MNDRSIPDNEDLAGGDTLDESTQEAAEFYRGQVASVTKFRWSMGGVAVVILLVLAFFLGHTLYSFNSRLVDATSDFAKNVASEPSKPAAADSSTASVAQASASPAAAAPKVATTATSPAKPTGSLAATLKVDFAAIANSVVAIVSILVLAIGVIVITLLKIVFSVVPEQLGGSKAAAKESAASDITTLGLEGGKIVFEALADLIKSLKK